MYLSIIFILSGLGIAALLIAKILEHKRGRKNFFLKAISRGEEKVRFYSQELAHEYFEQKEKLIIFLTKQFPMRIRGSLNKGQAILVEKMEEFTEKLRDSKLLKKSDGLSEFFKNMSDIEKGNGEINDTYEYNEKNRQNEKNEVDYKN